MRRSQNEILVNDESIGYVLGVENKGNCWYFDVTDDQFQNIFRSSEKSYDSTGRFVGYVEWNFITRGSKKTVMIPDHQVHEIRVRKI